MPLDEQPDTKVIASEKALMETSATVVTAPKRQHRYRPKLKRQREVFTAADFDPEDAAFLNAMAKGIAAWDRNHSS